ncbi:MFS transporter OpS2 [Beauveria bassiana]|nr:MFS transporter OpS2 [Beauveria bassiana]
MIFLLRHLPILFTSYYAALAFGSLYILNISIQKVFAEPPYGFSVSILGLCYIPSGLGFLLSALFGGKWADYIMKREAKRREVYDERGNLSLKPEDRMMENAWAAAVAFPAAMIWYGWTVDKGVFWVAPSFKMFANFVFGLSTMLIFSLAVTMLTEFIPRKPSSGVAVANFLRNIFSCAGILLGDPLLRIEGYGWMFTGLTILASSGIGVVWWMRNKGTIWREQNMAKLG